MSALFTAEQIEAAKSLAVAYSAFVAANEGGTASGNSLAVSGEMLIKAQARCGIEMIEPTLIKRRVEDGSLYARHTFAKGDQCWAPYDAGGGKASAASIVHGKVVAAGGRKFMVQWESGIRQRFDQGDWRVNRGQP